MRRPVLPEASGMYSAIAVSTTARKSSVGCSPPNVVSYFRGSFPNTAMQAPDPFSANSPVLAVKLAKMGSFAAKTGEFAEKGQHLPPLVSTLKLFTTRDPTRTFTRPHPGPLDPGRMVIFAVVFG